MPNRVKGRSFEAPLRASQKVRISFVVPLNIAPIKVQSSSSLLPGLFSPCLHRWLTLFVEFGCVVRVSRSLLCKRLGCALQRMAAPVPFDNALNDRQRHAVCAGNGAIIVLAGPGARALG